MYDGDEIDYAVGQSGGGDLILDCDWYFWPSFGKKGGGFTRFGD